MFIKILIICAYFMFIISKTFAAAKGMDNCGKGDREWLEATGKFFWYIFLFFLGIGIVTSL